MQRSVQVVFKVASLVMSLLVVSAGPTPAQESDTSVLRTTTRLVQLNVVVLDKQRHPVHGLSEDDFQVFDNGMLKKIVHFAAGPEPALTMQSVRSPLMISNRQTSTDRSPGVTVILVDELILDAIPVPPVDLTAPIRSARLSVLKFLSTLQPGEQVALYALRREGVVVLHDFTDDPTEMIAAAKRLGGGGVRGKTIVLDRLKAERVDSLNTWSQNAPSSKSYRAGEDASTVMRGYGFQAIVKHLEGVPGRRNLVWISSSLPMAATGFDLAMMANGAKANITPQPTLNNPTPTPAHSSPENHYDAVREFARWLSNANISVYPIDANGLTTGGHSEAQRAAADIIATETGGQIVFDSNRLDEHLREIVAESGASYQIGYYPGDSAWDGKYHHVEIRLARRTGLISRYRRGYFAAEQTAKQDEDAALWDAARSYVESPGIGLTVNVASNPLAWGPDDVVLKVDVRDIRFEQKGDRSNANLDIAFVQLGKDGRVVEGSKDRVAMALPSDVYDATESEGWFYPKTLWINPKAEKLRVVVRDLASGELGSVSVPIERHFKIK
jgi:VWFA-related protein